MTAQDFSRLEPISGPFPVTGKAAQNDLPQARRKLTPFRLADGTAARKPEPRASDLAMVLLQRGFIKPAHVMPPTLPLSKPQKPRPRDLETLTRAGTLSEAEMLTAAHGYYGAAIIDPMDPPPDPLLMQQVTAQACLRRALLPWRQAGAVTLIATARPGEFEKHRPWLEATYGPVTMVLAPQAQIEAAILHLRQAKLLHQAENGLPSAYTCRCPKPQSRNATIALWIILPLILLIFAPQLFAQTALGLALALMVASAGFKLLALLAALRRPAKRFTPAPPEDLPWVSIIVALYRESDIAPRLIKRLSRLDYPDDRLEILLVVEADDQLTRQALSKARLPNRMRVIIAEGGSLRTKPRALNLALAHCRGSIIGVYDAEDAPEPDQITKVVDHFHAAPLQVACLQGVLDYYNPMTNWFSRCFTLEYAAWFRLLLPGIARLGLAVPLGGTTLFFRREALEKLGGWDAYNVTEDADLGLRLFRQGFRTELIATVTREEANCASVKAWVRQRSRWTKGFLLTWAVHMRAPLKLWREVGTKAFIGIQIMILGAGVQSLLAPLIWSFWSLALGYSHPMQALLPDGTILMMVILFALAFAIDLAMALIGHHRSGHRFHPAWALTLPAYFPFATLAAYKALWEIIARPHYWDKTDHGKFDTKEPMARSVQP